MTTVSTKPYLIRAIHEWCVDQGLTPYLAAVVDANTLVPPGSARDGQIVLNVGYDATHDLVLGNEVITFQARFGGVVHSVAIPIGNVVAVYARENGQGMAFEVEAAEVAGDAEAPQPAAEEGTAPAAADGTPDGDSTGPGGGRPGGGRGAHLKVIK
ncbi:ClpXP protease specificity-enhancing factor [Pseudothauera rhizosphaerae]|uniref:ClpXP protease specificity-enhancing factor n=1 Tax=Pseudothauera rhizosphaerae TaxID=2565932 RepID=A0A4S4AJ26_9RHOO|nr:ClpXP protease specificity-enhancing factor [Pseudothauera rhizosphaerae]THF59292.1 ClpXP protease specificity-enhancing factor [Pseudothauera rhizosphaerae]